MPLSSRVIEVLDRLYRRYNRPEFISPDPMEVLFTYPDPCDREIAGLVSACLAFGNVKQILASVGKVLERMHPPRRYLESATRQSLSRDFAGFRHRYVTGDHVAAVLWGCKCAIERNGSLEACFTSHLCADDETLIPALDRFVDELVRQDGLAKNYLLPAPSRGSACKRWNMYLRWMVRRDAVDPGGWDGVPASKLVIPLDTHMFRMARALRLTVRNQADLRTALEVTAGFRAHVPEDPVRYDFALTRLGIRKDTDLNAFLNECGVRSAASKRKV